MLLLLHIVFVAVKNQFNICAGPFAYWVEDYENPFWWPDNLQSARNRTKMQHILDG